MLPFSGRHRGLEPAMTSHSSSGLGIYLVAHRRFRPKPPADGILKYKKKKEKRKKKNPPKLPPLIPGRTAPVAALTFRSGVKKYHSPLAGHAELVANIM